MFMDCNWPVNSGLVWNQDLCRCDWGPNRIIAKPDLNSESIPCLTSTVTAFLVSPRQLDHFLSGLIVSPF